MSGGDDGDTLDSLNWRPERPCRPEVMSVVRFVQDSLLADGLTYTAEQDDEENANCWVFTAADRAGYVNLGFLSWNEERQAVVYAAFKPEVHNRDVMEGFSEDDSKCYWMPDRAETFVLALNGGVREIVAEHRARQLRLLDGGGEDGQVAA